MGTAMILRASTSCWNNAPSIMVAVILGFNAAIKFTACTTSGQLWQESDTNTSKCNGVSIALICSMVFASTLGGWPPLCSNASTKEVNSWPIGMPANWMRALEPTAPIWNDGVNVALPFWRRLTLLESVVISSNRLNISVLLALESKLAISSIGACSFSR